MDTRAMATVLDLTPDRLLDDHGRMQLDEYLLLFEWAAKHFDRPHLGLELATQDSELSDFDVLLYMGSNTNSIAESFNVLLDYQRILMEGEIYKLYEHEEAAEVRLIITTGLSEHTAQDVEFSMGSIVSATTRLTGKRLIPIKTCFRHACIEPLADYHAVFGQNVYFDQPDNSMWVTYDDLSQRLSSPDPELLRILKDQADQRLSALGGARDFLEHVHLLISSNLTNECFSAEVLADQLHITSRTLHRRLKEHGTTFNKLRLEHVLVTARRALRDSGASISEIAQQLGYSDSSSFVRAFKRLQGESPLQYRKRRAD